MTRPVIGVTTSNRSGWRVFPIINLNLWVTGGRGLRWGAGRPVDLDAVDGIVIGGGDDISPELYSMDIKTTARLDPARDALEHELAQDALSRHIPVLGICRGAQMLNVAAGGSLHQDAWTVYPDAKPITTVMPKRKVQICDKTRLSFIAGTDTMRVNALHSQSVDRVGQGMRIAAQDSAGMVQAIEGVTDPFTLGVQWHPEYLIYAKRQRALFRALVVAARARAAQRLQTPEVTQDALASF
ncbi:gamma-glutamyl-gamma-aminobutyrate hydrolase family protein [Dinoroseobacter sp. S124A]|uniref:gamma-glutamyl-gamma-aminobutyrate hydrolase family protein n=1 Tax=Dinoroseobacter sp. S124A TaxID=3415128 RepID=UPI003C7C0C2B